MYCLDASVVVSSIIEQEPLHEYSARLLDKIVKDKTLVVFPTIAIPEVASALSRGTGEVARAYRSGPRPVPSCSRQTRLRAPRAGAPLPSIAVLCPSALPATVPDTTPLPAVRRPAQTEGHRRDKASQAQVESRACNHVPPPQCLFSESKSFSALCACRSQLFSK